MAASAKDRSAELDYHSSLMRILFSISYSMIFEPAAGVTGTEEVVVRARSSDWGKSGIRKYLHHTFEAIRILWHARTFDVLVLCNVGIEAFVIGKWGRFFCPGLTLVCFDLLMPREGFLVRRIQPWISGVDAFICIRSGDIPILERRFGISREQCHFVHFPAKLDISDQNPSGETADYIYSAGWAHRDWITLIDALAELPYRAVLSPGGIVTVPEKARDRIEVLPMQSPSAGRELMRKSSLVVLSLVETDLPSGPLVLLDAMTMGKAIVATDVNGSRDYLRHGETGILVPPGNPIALRSAIQEMMEYRGGRKTLGQAARDDACTRFVPEKCLRAILSICAQVRCHTVGFTRGVRSVATGRISPEE